MENNSTKLETSSTYELKSSGTEQQFEGGAVRDAAHGKPKMSFLGPYVWDQLPYGGYVRNYLLSLNIQHLDSMLVIMLEDQPDGWERLCDWLDKGAKRYSPFNWTKGMPITRCIDSLGRHLLAIHRNQKDEDHIAAALCNVMFIIHYHKAIKEGKLNAKWFDLWNYELINEE